MKMSFFFYNGNAVPWAFKICGMLQCICDCYLGVQYCMFGSGQSTRADKGSSDSATNGVDRWGMKDSDTRLS